MPIENNKAATSPILRIKTYKNFFLQFNPLFLMHFKNPNAITPAAQATPVSIFHKSAQVNTSNKYIYVFLLSTLLLNIAKTAQNSNGKKILIGNIAKYEYVVLITLASMSKIATHFLGANLYIT